MSVLHKQHFKGTCRNCDEYCIKAVNWPNKKSNANNKCFHCVKMSGISEYSKKQRDEEKPKAAIEEIHSGDE